MSIKTDVEAEYYYKLAVNHPGCDANTLCAYAARLRDRGETRARWAEYIDRARAKEPNNACGTTRCAF